MKTAARWMALFSLTLGAFAGGCGRSGPPEIPAFKPPVKPVAEETVTKVVADTGQPEPEPESPPEPENKPEKKVEKKTEAPPPEPEAKPEPKPEEPEAPTIIGTWRITEISHNGESQPTPDGFEMTFTFAEDGTLSTSMSHPDIPEARSTTGSYTAGSDGTITLDMEGESKSGTYSLEGDNKLILEVDKVRMVMERT